MADNVTVTPAASNIAFASGSTTHVTLSGNVSDSTSAYVGNIYVHGDQFDNTGFVIQNTKTGGGNQRSVIILAAEDGSIIRGQGGTTLGSMGADLGYINFEKTRNVKISEYADNGFLYLASGGNIGINTNAPSYELTLADKFMWDGNHWRANQTNGASMRNEVPSATNPVFTFNNDVDTGMSRAAADELSLITAGTEAIRVASSQNVGIGTSAPYQKVDIRGNLAVDNEINFDMDNNATAYGYINWDGYQGGDTQFRSLWIGDGRRSTQSSSPLAFFDGTTRRVGIGTATPAGGLHINSTDSSQLRITSGSAGTFCDFEVSQYGGLTLDVNHSLVLEVTRHLDYKVGSGRLHRFYENNVEKMRLDDGKLGIGTTAPSDKLHVNGTTKLDGQMNFGTLGDGTNNTADDSKTVWKVEGLASPGGNATGTITLPTSPTEGDYYIICAVAGGETDPGIPADFTGTTRITATHTLNGQSGPIVIGTATGVGNFSYNQLHCVYDGSNWSVTKSTML